MEIVLTNNDLVIDDRNFPRLCFIRPSIDEQFEGEVSRIDGESRNRLMQTLREDPVLAARFLATGSHRLVYMGPARNERVSTPSGVLSVGMGYDRNSATNVLRGDNAWGQLLEGVRRDIRRELSRVPVEEPQVARDAVVVDYTVPGVEETHIEMIEKETGEKFIHLDPVPARRRGRRVFDTALNGTTGHAGRDDDDGISFHTFENPFGLTSTSFIRVHNAAEMSYYYEQALRGELDFAALIDRLNGEGFTNYSDQARDAVARELSSRFEWMRERIVSGELAGRRLVAPSLAVPDDSMGRSVYDPVYAPSPAHVLARYIGNPLLLYLPSVNGVAAALERGDKHEPDRFSSLGREGVLNIAVFGSDTIGGRVPGTRTAARNTTRQSVGFGSSRTVAEKDVYLNMKSPDEIEADYDMFRERMEDILSNAGPDLRVRFITGKGIGIPQMVERFVTEHGGAVYNGNIVPGGEDGRNLKLEMVSGDDAGEARFSAVHMPRFSDFFPVIAGDEEEITVVDETGKKPVEMTLSAGDVKDTDLKDLGIGCAVCYSAPSDRADYFDRQRVGIAMNAGIPVIRVLDNLPSNDQKIRLDSASRSAVGRLESPLDLSESLFTEERNQWDVRPDNGLQHVSNLTMLGRRMDSYTPVVFDMMPSAVYIGGQSFRTVYGAYLAFLASDSGRAEEDRAEMLRRIAAAEGSSDSLSGISGEILAGAPDGLRSVERALRLSVDLFARNDTHFADLLVDTPEDSFVMVSTNGDDTLFVGPDGRGRNLFGIVLADERRRVAAERGELSRAAARRREQEIEERVQNNLRYDKVRADGEKVAGGLPKALGGENGRVDAVWFGATNRPSELALPDGKSSYDAWNTEYGKDPLIREKAVNHPDTSQSVILFPSDDMAVRGKRVINNQATSYDLTGARRRDKATGREYVCAVGVPVKHNYDNYELVNRYGMPCSFKLDTESSAFLDSIVVADAKARSIAIEHGLGLMTPVTVGRSGEIIPVISGVFRDQLYGKIPGGDVRDLDFRNMTRGELMEVIGREKLYDIPLEHYETVDGREVSVQTELPVLRDAVASALEIKYHGVPKASPMMTKGYYDNPHAAPVNRGLVERHQNILMQGMDYPLNYIVLPRADYHPGNGMSDKERSNMRVRFMADLNMSLAIMNETAKNLGVPMKFPLNSEGLVDFGPGVPEELAKIGRNRIDSFIGTAQSVEVADGILDSVTRLQITDFIPSAMGIKTSGADLYVRPNDLAAAFGPYEFDSIANGNTAPLHEMTLRMGDGTLVKLVDSKLSRSLKTGELNRFLKYDNNEERCFRVYCSDPEKVNKHLATIRGYIDRASRMKVEFRLVSESDVKASDEMPQAGYMEILSSNSDELATLDYQFGARPVDSLSLPSRFDGTDGDSRYYGKVDARDGFKGWVELRATLPDGAKTGWKVIADRALAYDVFMATAIRTYRSDLYNPPSSRALDLFLRAYAIEANQTAFCAAAGKEEDMDLSREQEAVLADVSPDAGVEPVVAEPAAKEEPVPEVEDIVDEMTGDFTVSVEEHVGKWTREEAAAHPDVLYVFSDNTDRDSGKGVIDRDSDYYRKYGNGTDDLHYPTVTAAVLRGLDNAMPVSTQRWYHAGASGVTGRWNDSDSREFAKVIRAEFADIRRMVESGNYSAVVFPEGGLAYGKISAITPERTPKLFKILDKEVNAFKSYVRQLNGEGVSERNGLSKAERQTSQFKIK